MIHRAFLANLAFCTASLGAADVPASGAATAATPVSATAATVAPMSAADRAEVIAFLDAAHLDAPTIAQMLAALDGDPDLRAITLKAVRAHASAQQQNADWAAQWQADQQRLDDEARKNDAAVAAAQRQIAKDDAEIARLQAELVQAAAAAATAPAATPAGATSARP